MDLSNQGYTCFWLTAIEQRRENPESTFSWLNKDFPLTFNQGARERRETSLRPPKKSRGLLL